MPALRTLRVGLDGRAFASPAAGVRRYVWELASALLALDEPLDLVALGGSPGALPPGVAHVGEPWHPWTNLGWTAIGVPRAASRARVDLIHAPAYTAPPWTPIPTVVTIHDVSYERRPEYYPYRRDRMRRAFYRWSARAASHILTDSKFSRDEIQAAYAVPPDRVTVVPLGVSVSFTRDRATAVPLQPGVPQPFLLHVGDLHARRNIAVVVKALDDVRRRTKTPLALVLAGVDRGSGQDLAEIASAVEGPPAVVRLGPVRDEQLRALYGAAVALVYPSKYEGFGLPVLEAMASGAPVIASRAASLPEVVGEAGLLIDPDHVSGWSDAIVNVWQDSALRDRLRAAGAARAAQFTWARTARATLEVYRRVHEARR